MPGITSTNIFADGNASPFCRPLYVAQPPLRDDGRPVIRKVLIANRGEIACRIIKTCRKLHMKSIAVYADEDAYSRHVTDADEAINIGSIDRSKVNPFLDMNLLVQTAVSAGAQAVHPGYGYLSENADFANRVREAGLIFIGPSASAMSSLGDKRASKVFLCEHAPEVPLIPGFSGSSQDVEALGVAAEEIGFPIMVKASAGGGGKGMRVVREPGQLKDELARAQSEANRSFGSSDCILEKYIENSKHVEIQIMGDSHGRVVSFFDRDCSVQRRHQKVIEETPCPFLSQKTRQEMSDTAVRIASLIGYENAGTVEFIFDVSTERFYFLEVNARLQVEHPITEEVTGFDLVSLQFFVAAGGNLNTIPALGEITQTGASIECRLTAENPKNNFLPEHGKVHMWLPAGNDLSSGRDIRYETAIQTGSSVSIYFDSMIAKLVVWAPTRSLAIERMQKVLANTACVGVKTNQLFLQACLSNKEFRNPAYTTSFIPNNLGSLLHPPFLPRAAEIEPILSIISSLTVRSLAKHVLKGTKSKPFHNVRRQFRNQRLDPVNIHCDVITMLDSPYVNVDKNVQSSLCLWKAEEHKSSTALDEAFLVPVPQENHLQSDSKSAATEVSIKYNNISQELRSGKYENSSPYRVRIDEWQPAEGSTANFESCFSSKISVSINRQKVTAYVCLPSIHPHTLAGQIDRSQRVFCHLPEIGTYVELKRDTLLSFAGSVRSLTNAKNEPEQKTVTAPMPCKVLSILKSKGDYVNAGDSVMIIESMKMEINIAAASSGTFETNWKEGDAVEDGKVLCSVI
ncbi:uncharacterized protein N7469_004897 [Penicillium citrinum]|uniref:Uncharacterized protein n=1 Tax=Penicillium citrinum TaxID=5077 RepID=A0A9W9P5B3_PENCI|nr:uncharacterized protein N7469_004897 [Penicillium citrinum]KAJ5235729.1 hypothetical protein N7469_004897 [Penicillium citrinum]